ncbi:SDR family NAD(P)-dependent oxidoreductase [Arthrobacter sp. OAP107]|uniref:SDR family NAD(P)-dependent oxidoreductase n=1 Tax=Arthrobacter sp. OAP107 TaxID=3156445 RepID=UPI00339689FE
MTTIAIIGAGRGLGAATAKRFGRGGFDVALISRTQEHVDLLARDLVHEGSRHRASPQPWRTASR